MAEGGESNTGIYFAILLVVVGVIGLVWLARDAARGTVSDLSRLKEVADNNRAATTVSETGESDSSKSVEGYVAPQGSWVTYRDQTWGYTIRFPKTYRARLLDSAELTTPLPGESLLSGIVVATSLAVKNQKPDYGKPSLTLLVTNWPSFGSSENFLNETYTNGTVPQDQIERVSMGGKDALQLEVHSSRGGVNTSHTEILIPGPGSRVIKIIYWPSSDTTLAAIARTLNIQ